MKSQPFDASIAGGGSPPPVDVVVFCAGAVQSVVPNLLQTYERRSGNRVKFEFGTAGVLAKRVAEGAVADVVIGAAPDLGALAETGKVDGGSIRTLGSMGVGLAVRAGAPMPDVHDVESFKQTLLDARSVAHGSPAKGGQSGIHIAKVLAQFGIDKQLGARLHIRDTGRDAFKEVAKGEIEIGLGQISEIIANKDVAMAGPFPAGIQGGVTFAAAVHGAAANKDEAEAIIRCLTEAAAKERFRAAGFAVT